jgi:hypothetical protein
MHSIVQPLLVDARLPISRCVDGHGSQARLFNIELYLTGDLTLILMLSRY